MHPPREPAAGTCPHSTSSAPRHQSAAGCARVAVLSSQIMDSTVTPWKWRSLLGPPWLSCCWRHFLQRTEQPV